MPIHKTKNEKFFKKWSPQMAYVLGFFAADGSMYKTKRGTNFIEFQITDGDLLKEIKNALGSNHKITKVIRNKNQKPIYRIQIGSKEIFRDLLRFGLTPAKSKILRMPLVPAKYFADFLRGYFDGDGCVHLGKYWRKDRNKWIWQLVVTFTSGSLMFLKELWSILRPHVRGGRIGNKNGGFELVFSRRDALALFNLMYNNSAASIFLKRKYDIFKKAFKVLNMRP